MYDFFSASVRNFGCLTSAWSDSTRFVCELCGSLWALSGLSLSLSSFSTRWLSVGHMTTDKTRMPWTDLLTGVYSQTTKWLLPVITTGLITALLYAQYIYSYKHCFVKLRLHKAGILCFCSSKVFRKDMGHATITHPPTSQCTLYTVM